MIDCKLLFLKDGKILFTLTKEDYGIYVIVHGIKGVDILGSIQDFIEHGAPLPADITKLNLNIANASMEEVSY